MTLPQFPNFFYGTVQYQGEPAPIGMIVTALVGGDGLPQRYFCLGVGPRGKFGAPNGNKLKVGGSGDPIPDQTRIAYFCTEGPLDASSEPTEEAGHSHFHADNMPHITRLVLCQD